MHILQIVPSPFSRTLAARIPYRVFALATALVATAVGCGGQPFPRVATEGSTIVIPVPGGYGAGFGRSRTSPGVMDPNLLHASLPVVPYPAVGWDPVNDPPGVTEVPGEPLGAYLEDELRGELVFRLWGNGTMGSPVTYLPVRHITRVHVDEASRASLGTGGQVLAMVDIPPGVVAANLGETDFLIEVRRYRRIAGDPVAFEETTPTSDGFDWFGWSHPGNFGIFKIPITINASADAIGSFNEFRGWDKHAGRYKEFAIAADLATMVPRPTMGMSVFKSGGAAAAAWQIELTYPEEKVRLVGVSAWRNQRSAATTFLTPLTPEPVPDAAGCVPSGEGRVRVSAFEPSIGIGRVDLIVEPRPLTCAGRLATNELVLRPSTLRVYDFDGADISSTGYGASQGSKFR